MEAKRGHMTLQMRSWSPLLKPSRGPGVPPPQEQCLGWRPGGRGRDPRDLDSKIAPFPEDPEPDQQGLERLAGWAAGLQVTLLWGGRRGGGKKRHSGDLESHPLFSAPPGGEPWTPRPRAKGLWSPCLGPITWGSDGDGERGGPGRGAGGRRGVEGGGRRGAGLGVQRNPVWVGCALGDEDTVGWACVDSGDGVGVRTRGAARMRVLGRERGCALLGLPFSPPFASPGG